MSQSEEINTSSDNENDYDVENVQEEDEDDWQDAEEQPSVAPVQRKKTEQKTIDEAELRKKIRIIQQNVDLDPREKAKQIQVCFEYKFRIVITNNTF